MIMEKIIEKFLNCDNQKILLTLEMVIFCIGLLLFDFNIFMSFIIISFLILGLLQLHKLFLIKYSDTLIEKIKIRFYSKRIKQIMKLDVIINDKVLYNLIRFKKYNIVLNDLYCIIDKLYSLLPNNLHQITSITIGENTHAYHCESIDIYCLFNGQFYIGDLIRDAIYEFKWKNLVNSETSFIMQFTENGYRNNEMNNYSGNLFGDMIDLTTLNEVYGDDYE